MRHASRILPFPVLVVILSLNQPATPARAADYTPPADGKLTETQVVNYIAVMHDQMQAIKAGGNASSGSSGAAAMAIYAQTAHQIDAALAKHNLTSAEFDWIGARVSPVWPIAVSAYKWDQSGKADIQNQIKSKQQDADAARAKLATYQKAQAAGQRVLTPDQLAAATQPATADRDSAQSDIKDATASLKSIHDEIAQHQQEAADADALAKNPPADISPDDRPGYIDGKKNDAQTARDAVKDSEAKLPDAQKALDDASVRLAAANARLAHPEVPASDDEKAQVKQENEQAIADAQSTIDNDAQAIALLQQTLAAGPPGVDQLKPQDKQNLPVIQKHLPELMDALGASAILK
jgi:predicted  nucleic acid-binding Zn-ribbon protein